MRCNKTRKRRNRESTNQRVSNKSSSLSDWGRDSVRESVQGSVRLSVRVIVAVACCAARWNRRRRRRYSYMCIVFTERMRTLVAGAAQSTTSSSNYPLEVDARAIMSLV